MLFTLLSTPADPEPYHTSILSGQMWVDELLDGHPDRIRCELGLRKEDFRELIHVLRSFGEADSRYVTLEEQLAIFLYTSVTGLTIRHAGERFQRSSDTISKYFRKMLIVFSSPPFYTTYVTLPNASTPPSQRMCHNLKYWPFFQHALGAIDGTHIACAPAAHERAMYRNRKGFLSQNCLFACTFDLNFVFGYTGWEGSATDSQVWEAALDCGFDIPNGYYYLADSGYPGDPRLLLPYRGVRYHLAEWSRASEKYVTKYSVFKLILMIYRPRTKEELFNLRHASARNAIERIFGVVKNRFRILRTAPEYSMALQARIPVALAALYNFIRIREQEQEGEVNDEDELHPIGGWVGDGDDEAERNEGFGEFNERREQIAVAMWAQYLEEHVRRGIPVPV